MHLGDLGFAPDVIPAEPSASLNDVYCAQSAIFGSDITFAPRVFSETALGP